MKKIMIDMDDVITDGNLVKWMEESLGCKINTGDYENYYLQDMLGDKKASFFEKHKKGNLYDDVELFDHCYRVMEKLSHSYEIYICTAYIWRELVEYAGYNLKNKYEFLRRNLPFIEPNHFIFTGDKSIVDCPIKIDDKIENLRNAEIKILFTAYHNKNISDNMLQEKNIIRVDSWMDIEKILLE